MPMYTAFPKKTRKIREVVRGEDQYIHDDGEDENEEQASPPGPALVAEIEREQASYVTTDRNAPQQQDEIPVDVLVSDEEPESEPEPSSPSSQEPTSSSTEEESGSENQNQKKWHIKDVKIPRSFGDAVRSPQREEWLTGMR